MVFDPERIWDELTGLKAGPGWLMRRLDPLTKVGVVLGIHHPGCRPSVLVEVHSGTADEGRDWPNTRGVEVKPDRWGEALGIRLTLTEPALRSVFASLVVDLVSLSSGVDPAKRVRARLEAWLSLLSRRRSDGMERHAILALLSELEIFRRLSSDIPIPILVNGWEGPLDDLETGRGLHDFRIPGVRLEVKSTARVPVHAVTISRHAQLDPDVVGNDALLLVVVCWSSETKGAQTLPEMVASVRALTDLHPIARLDLDDRLRAAGWIDADTGLYADRAWNLLEIRWYKVAGDFPRIRCRDMSPGIIDGEYSISIQACETWRVDEVKAKQIASGQCT